MVYCMSCFDQKRVYGGQWCCSAATAVQCAASCLFQGQKRRNFSKTADGALYSLCVFELFWIVIGESLQRHPRVIA